MLMIHFDITDKKEKNHGVNISFEHGRRNKLFSKY